MGAPAVAERDRVVEIAGHRRLVTLGEPASEVSAAHEVGQRAATSAATASAVSPPNPPSPRSGACAARTTPRSQSTGRRQPDSPPATLRRPAPEDPPTPACSTGSAARTCPPTARSAPSSASDCRTGVRLLRFLWVAWGVVRRGRGRSLRSVFGRSGVRSRGR